MTDNNDSPESVKLEPKRLGPAAIENEHTNKTFISVPSENLSSVDEAESNRVGMEDYNTDSDQSNQALPKISSIRQSRKIKRSRSIGIIGGKGVGKTYLLQSMLYRTQSIRTAGALTGYIKKGKVTLTRLDNESDGTDELNRFLQNYQKWIKLNQTTRMDQQWYCLSIHFRNGLFGMKKDALQVDFFDASGEMLQGQASKEKQFWNETYLHASTIIFCLPTWVAFPAHDLSEKEQLEREDIFDNFTQVIQNYSQTRKMHDSSHSVRIVLALTMADDTRRCGLEYLHEQWIKPYQSGSRKILKKLATGRGLIRYLNNAKITSERLWEVLSEDEDQGLIRILDGLAFDEERPWLIPMSAIDGEMLETYNSVKDKPRRSPVPVHVELPLLIALCDQTNALM